MSSANLELIRRGAEALNARDAETLVALTTEDVVVIAARSAVEGAFVGHAGVRRFVDDNEQSFERFELRLDEVRERGECVFASGTVLVRGRGVGVEAATPFAGTFTIRDGKIARWEDFRDHDAALAAAGFTR